MRDREEIKEKTKIRVEAKCHLRRESHAHIVRCGLFHPQKHNITRLLEGMLFCTYFFFLFNFGSMLWKQVRILTIVNDIVEEWDSKRRVLKDGEREYYRKGRRTR